MRSLSKSDRILIAFLLSDVASGDRMMGKASDLLKKSFCALG